MYVYIYARIFFQVSLVYASPRSPAVSRVSLSVGGRQEERLDDSVPFSVPPNPRRGHSDDRGTREARVHSYMRVGCLLLIHRDALFSEENGLENYFLECWWCDSLNGVY